MSDSREGKKYRRLKDKGRVHPDSSSFENNSYEMDDVDRHKANNIDKFQTAAKKTLNTQNALNMIVNLKASASRWRRYATTRRKMDNPGSGIDRKRTGGLGLEYEVANYDVMDSGPLDKTQKQIMVAQNRNLIEYFANIGHSKNADECVNLEYVEKLLKSGAKIDCTDKYGQTVFHEVARAWHVDVAKFMIEHGANIDQGDNYGRTPLHIAAAVDYPEMVEFLIKNGANKEACTKGEHQTPVHFAARNDACSSLKALIKEKCEYKEIRDYKQRTPLHVAAELDRSETARLLLELDDPAPAGVEDDSGQAAIVCMISKMPPVAKVALDQFHTTDRANRRQYYHLHKLEPRKPGEDNEKYPQTAMQVLANVKQYELITHPAVKRLIRNKWKKFGLRGALLSTLINLLFIVMWSIQGILIEYDKRHLYILPSQWWRILLFAFALILTVYQLEEELSEFIHSKKVHKQWTEWREKEIERDLEHAHPRWPEERAYLLQERDYCDKMRPQYFNDFWNIYDWICYAFLMVVIITHVVDICDHTNFTARLHIRIMAVTIILLWLRLMKNARAFSLLGPFIVMMGHMLTDVLKFAFLYLEFYIPYACAFWMLFGENKVPEEFQGLPGADNYTVTVSGMATGNALMFSLFRMTLVDDYDYEGMKAVDSIMADLLVGTWLAISAVLVLNLLIALLSDTFQRVYDNAQANAVMQKAIFIINNEESMKPSRREKFREFIHTKCCPEEDFYDDDTTEAGGDDLKKVAFQIKDQIDDLKDNLQRGKYQLRGDGNSSDENNDGHGPAGGGSGSRVSKEQFKQLVTSKKLETEIDVLRDDVQILRDQQEQYMSRLKKELVTMRSLLQQIASNQGMSPSLAPLSLEGYPPLVRRTSVLSAGQASDIQQIPMVPRPAPLATSGVYQMSPGASIGMMTRQGTMPPTRGTVLSATAEEDDWEISERKRKQELEELRKQLADKARSSSIGTLNTTQPRPSITPNNTSTPDGQ